VVRLPVGVNPGITVRVVAPASPPADAWIVVCPGPTAVAKPPPVIVATAVADELHAATLVKFWVLLSEYVPVAVNCWVVFSAIEGFAGETLMDCSVGPVTMSELLPATAPSCAVIVVEPALIPVPNPEPLITATPVDDELHTTELVRFCILPFV
jgi:hypothetical protein